nr:MAG TPA: hypothetical protein [Caudoviricetes sp.]
MAFVLRPVSLLYKKFFKKSSGLTSKKFFGIMFVG